MTITFKIDNPDIEKQLRQFVKEQKELTLDAFNSFVSSFQKTESSTYPKKDPAKHIQFIHRDYNSDDVDEVALTHIHNSAEYVHDLRRKKR